MDKARVKAISSGISTQPPRKLKPVNSGVLHCNGLPVSSTARPGTTSNSGIAPRDTGKYLPVASNRAFDQRDSNTMPMIATTTAPKKVTKLSEGLGAGIYKPRLLRKKV